MLEKSCLTKGLLAARAYPLLGEDVYQVEDYAHVDLSTEHTKKLKITVTSYDGLYELIDQEKRVKNAKVLFGGYLEKRDVYNNRDLFKCADSALTRNIHMGIDLFACHGDDVYAPLDGIVHSLGFDEAGYGTVVILQHKIGDYLFYGLYGHLELGVLRKLKTGAILKQGERFASLGDRQENGDWPPHIHFQLIVDIGSYQADYPATCCDHNLAQYKSNCPNPLVVALITAGSKHQPLSA